MTDLLVRPPADALAAAAADYLYGLPRGSKSVGLARAEELFGLIGSPQNAVPTVHVAGTAGKGSVSAFTSAALTAHGFRVGTHVSPHVRSILERFQFDGAPVPPHEFVDAVHRLAPAISSVAGTRYGSPTFFEATNAIAFSLFAERAVDYAVVETGIGGLLDATNTIGRRDKLAVISRIGIDHTHLLGETTAEIAAHKAGILPIGGQAVVLRHHQDSVRTTISHAARLKRCRTEIVDPREVSCTVDPAGTVLHVGTNAFQLGLQGHHQGVNAALALHAVHLLAERDGWRVEIDAVRAGLAGAWLPGRFERHCIGGRDVVLDGAHNNVKLVALVDTVRAFYPDRHATWVLAAKADKDLQSVLAAIAPIAGHVVATELPSDSAGPAAPSMPAAEVAEQARTRGLRTVTVTNPAAAVEAALRLGDGPVVVTGSFLHLAAADTVLAGRPPFCLTGPTC